jgi:hypothetical protein
MIKAYSVMVLTLLLMSILVLAFNVHPVKAEIIELGHIGTIHWGSGIVRDSQFFNFGTGEIFWSVADEERGYFYGSDYSSPTVFFADKISNYWGSYDSYRGLKYIWEFTNASEHEWFTEHVITFAEESSPYYTGILLIYQGGLYGAIKPKSIHNGDLSHPEEYVLEFDWWYDDSGNSDFSILKPTIWNVTIDIKPDTLNLKGKGRWITSYIELPEGYNVGDINVSSIMLNNTIGVDSSAPVTIGDYDNDTIPDLMVKFDRATVCNFILSKGVRYGNVTLMLSGKLYDGTLFEGYDIIRVRMPGDLNLDGKVDMKDISIATKAFGSYPSHSRWNPIADENEDNKIDMVDIALICRNFGKTY